MGCQPADASGAPGDFLPVIYATPSRRNTNLPSDGRLADGSARSLSEQLRELEAQLGSINEMSLPAPGQRSRLPMSLGRPIGLTQPEGFPRILSAGTDDDADSPPPARGGALRRGIAVAGSGLLLLTATAILPSLIWPHVQPPAPPVTETPAAAPRTERFAFAARDMALAPHAPASVSTPALLPARAAPEPIPEPRMAPDSAPSAGTTLEVAESDLASLNLPKIVSGVAPASTGTAVVIDGLPDTARVSPGIRIARDSWAVGIRDVDNAVLSLPRDTPERLDLVVRVVAADSHELAANRLHIRVLRTVGAAEPTRHTGSIPTAHFEPAAAVGAPVPEVIEPRPARKPAVVLKRTPAPSATPSPAWSTEISAWSQTAPSPQPPVERAPAWAPFGTRTAP